MKRSLAWTLQISPDAIALPASLRASGLGLAYGTSNIGKFIGPLGLAVIAGSSNFVKLAAIVAALVPAFNYFAVWWALAAAAFWFIGFETSGRSIEEIDAQLTGRALVGLASARPA